VSLDSRAVPRRILYVFNSAAFFASHRLDVARRFGAAGAELHLAAPPPFPAEVDAAVRCHPWPLARDRPSPVNALSAALGLRRIVDAVRPDLAEFASIQPALLGGLGSLGRPGLARVFWITGLGWAFTGKGLGARLAGAVARTGYRLALGGRRTRVIFENPDDLRRFAQAVPGAARSAAVIPGAGVDLERFRPAPEPPGDPVILLAARLLRSKGVTEFGEAASLLRERGVACRFVLAGAPDPGNPESLTAEEVSDLVAGAGVEWSGYRADMPALYAASHIVCLPSWAEGCPKVLLEAAAAGRPAVGSDIPGIRMVIQPDVTGILIPVRDVAALADAIERLVCDVALRRRLGESARRLAEAEFGIATTADRVARVYASVLDSSD
jgi:glycosyltransferase involved in cell wall biosynthesis